jgi:hypothetical protein
MIDAFILVAKVSQGKRINTPSVLSVSNSEIRRYLIKRIGYGNMKKHTPHKIIHVDGTSELIDFIDLKERYVKVKDSSTDREYLLFVESSCKTCREAIAWTFGLTEAEYSPIMET